MTENIFKRGGLSQNDFRGEVTLHGIRHSIHRFNSDRPLKPSGDESRSGIADGSCTCSAESSLHLLLLGLPTHAGEDGSLETVSEVGTQKTVDARVDAAVEVGQEVEGSSHWF